MMQKLKLLGLLNQTISNAQLCIHDKVMDGTNTKENCSSHHDNIETTSRQLDNTKRLSMILDCIPDICENIKLNHDPYKFYVLPMTSIMEFLKEDEWLDNTI